jgi:V/A-type H+-transporting ATPase subunit I
MTSTSIILARKNLDSALEALHDFGHFHIEDTFEIKKTDEYRLPIQQVEGDLSILDTLTKDLDTDKRTFMDIFRMPKTIKTKITSESWQTVAESMIQEVASLNKEASRLSAQLKNLHTEASKEEHVRDMLEAMKSIGTDLAAIKELKTIAIRIGWAPKRFLPELERALSRFPMIFHSCYLSKEASFICMAFPVKHKSDIDLVLNTYHSEIFDVPDYLPHDVSNALAEIRNRLKENEKNQATLKKAFKDLGASNRQKLRSLRETTQNILVLLKAKQKALQSDRIAVIKGFLPSSQTKTFHENIDSKLKGNALILEDKIPLSEDPPTLVRNSRFVKPFEEITGLYGVPHYDELDPTPFIAIMFPIIFGLMFGDMGHGLVLAIGGLTLGFLVKNHQAIKNMCWILAASGVGAAIAGLLFGEFFGMHLFPPLWFNPFDNVLSFLVFSLFVGVVQILTGMILELVDFALVRSWLDVFLTSIPKIAFYLGSVYLVAVYGLQLGAWFTGPILVVIVPFLVLVFGKFVFLKATSSISRKLATKSNDFSLMQRFFESGDLVTRLLSNTVSYARILALLMAHWALLLVTYTVAGLVSASEIGIFLGAIIIVGGNLFVIALEGLIVFIHTLRLHFYEWFSKFYRGTGTAFSPFQQRFDYTEIVLGESARG